MDVRRLAIGFLAVLACSRSSQDAGIALNVDTDVTADRTVIDHITVTVDGKKQEWTLTRPLPGSLGIVTSPGNKSVTVEGFSNGVLRGRWSGSIVASKGKVVVQDVHLAYVGSGFVDAGPSSVDSSGGEVIGTGGVRDASIDASGVDLGGAGGISGKGGTSGRPTLPGVLDSGAGGITGTGGVSSGTGGISGRDGGDVSGSGGVDGSDGSLPNKDGASGVTAPFTGAFSVSSQFQVHATAATPGALGGTLQLVHGLVDDPGTAILNFAEDAGVPGLSTLRSVLPDALMSRLSGWMNSYIKTASVGGVTPYDQLVWLDSTVQALLLYWGLQSRLALPVNMTGTHAPISLIFNIPSGSPLSFPLGATAPVTSGVGVAATVSWPNGTDGAAVVSISDHFMGLPFGRYALQALDAILLAQYGTPNLAAYLANAVGCSGMAQYVASQCVSIVCVGHEADLLDVCEGGLAEGGRQIENQILGLDFMAIHFENGTAIAVGAQVSRPQDATALQNGVWTSTVDFGNGPEPATATFFATAE